MDKLNCHKLRKPILAEVHARPYVPMPTPRSLLQQAFLCPSSANAEDDIIAFQNWCKQNDLPIPDIKSRHHHVKFENVYLTWQRHTEFISISWEGEFSKNSQEKFWQLSKKNAYKMMAAKYPLISAASLEMQKLAKNKKIADLAKNFSDYDEGSLCVSMVDRGKAIVITDFLQDEFGATRFQVYNKGMDDRNSGILVRRLLELETYRIMALYGFERIKEIFPDIANIEKSLVKLTESIDARTDLHTTRKRLDEITDIAADLASLSARRQYRFSATKAYYKLVKARLLRLVEERIPDFQTLEEFLNKRQEPAMRTVANVERRIIVAGEKLDRTSGLLRTKVEIQIQVQSHEVLDTMNKRTLMQYRLQSTVEGLSIAAVSYYIVGLLVYIFKGLGTDDIISPKRLAAFSVPVVVLFVWFMIRRIRARHK